MKIYFKIESKDIQSFKSYCSTNNYFIPESPNIGYYCIDNAYSENNKLLERGLWDLGTELPTEVPSSFILKWDPKHIDDLINNRIIGRFNQNKLQWTLMNSKAMEPMIQVLMYGAQKYDRDNWLKACPKRLDLMDSLERHSLKIIAGESIDPESGLPHIGHLMCNAMFYSYWEQKTSGQFEDYVDIDQPL